MAQWWMCFIAMFKKGGGSWHRPHCTSAEPAQRIFESFIGMDLRNPHLLTHGLQSQNSKKVF